MSDNAAPVDVFSDDEMTEQIDQLALGLYKGNGGATELARLIELQAALIAKRRTEAARRRALAA